MSLATNLLLIVAGAVPLFAAPAFFSFVAAGDPLGPYRRFSLEICAGDTAVMVDGRTLAREALERGVAIPTRVELQRQVEAGNRKSFVRILGIAVEAGSYLYTAAVAADIVRVNEKYSAAASAALGGILRVATTATASPPTELPRDIWPGFAVVQPGPCAQFTVFGLAK